MASRNKVLLIVLDGWGHREEREHNAIAEAETPYFDHLWTTYPHALLEASGEAVGLPEGQMGNSEVGHTTIGAGRVIYTDFVKISKSIREGTFGHNEAIITLFDHIKEHNSTLHLQSLIGPGGVHSHIDHLYAALRAAKAAGITKVAIHAFSDGRDTPPQSGAGYLSDLESMIEDLGIGFIATVTGRFYAMDRDNNWDRLKIAEDAIFKGIGVSKKMKPSAALHELYREDIVDEHIKPIIFLDQDDKSWQIEPNDGIFMLNFRSDRARMLAKNLIEKQEEMNLAIVTMTEYDKKFNSLVAFMPEEAETTLAQEIAESELTQEHIAETEKFAHATYFLNGGEETPHRHEKHTLVKSRKDVDTHDLAPEMKAAEITEKTLESIKDGTDLIFVNYANPDMVGHTANKDALLQAISFVDQQLKQVTDAALENSYAVLVTADHGNAEIYFDKTNNEKHTAHTIDPVPLILVSNKIQVKKIDSGSLRDIAPTILSILDLKVPDTMTGQNLIKK
ncbi:MAG: 2,3-bisphosphoglycerate-independent phosphoglycerate mutase [Candidatus Berkelbacteria bacterium]